MKRATIVLLVVGALATTAEAQDNLAERLQARLKLELKTALTQLEKSAKELALQELATARLAAQVDRFAKSLIEDKLHDRLRALLLSKEGKKLVEEFMTEQQMETVDSLVESYFEKDKSGQYRVIEEFEEVLGQLLDSYEPAAPGSIGIDLLIDKDRPIGAGVRVAAVTPGGAAAAAGIKSGDVVISVAGRDLTSANVEEVMKSLSPEQNVKIVYERDKVRTTVTVKAK